MTKIIECRGITKSYQTGRMRVAALRGVDFEVEERTLRLLIGPSGSGKTTLLSIIGGILSPDGGRCTIEGTVITALSDEERTQFRKTQIGFLFQTFNLLPMLSVKENVAIPLILNGMEFDQALTQTDELLQRVEMGDKSERLPSELSGGEQQRVAIARAIIHRPKIVICDEPTSYLDMELGMKIMQLLRQLIDEAGATLIVVSHDLRLTPFADEIAYLEDGRIK